MGWIPYCENFEANNILVTMTQPVSWLEQEPAELKVLTNPRRRFHLPQRNSFLNARCGCHFTLPFRKGKNI